MERARDRHDLQAKQKVATGSPSSGIAAHDPSLARPVCERQKQIGIRGKVDRLEGAVLDDRFERHLQEVPHPFGRYHW